MRIPARLVLTLCLIGPTGAFAQDDLKGADPYDAARVVLTAYKIRDMSTLALMGNQTNRQILAELAAQGEDHPRYDSFAAMSPTP